MFLLHSDPHVGNFLVDGENEEKRIGVLDRDYYLHLSKADVEVLNKLIYEPSPRNFAGAFIERLLELNNVGGLQKQLQKGKILGKLGVQIAKGEGDNMTLMRTLLTEFSEAGMNVPIEMRVMIRNVEAFKRLNRRFGMELSNAL
jgi:predicted unusual protein kinase regulating ubiquinone biosynthesis (AarF/ABC1/UbiB family)